MELTKTQIQDNIVSELPPIVHGILLVAMRVGKTRITIEQLKKEDCNSVLWVTPSPTLRDKDLPEEFIKWDAKGLRERTKFVTYDGLSKEEGSYDKIVLDEIQDTSVRNTKNLLNGKLQFNTIIGLTGKMPKHKEKLEIYSKLNLHVIKEVDIEDAINLNLISNYKMFIINTKLSESKDLEIKIKTSSFKTSEKDNYAYLDKQVEKDSITNIVGYDWKTNSIEINKKIYTLKEFIPKFECDKSYLVMDKDISKGYIAIKNKEIFGKINSYPDYSIKNFDLLFRPTQFAILNRMRFIYNLKSKTQVAKQLITKLKGRTIVFSGSIEQSESISKNTFHSKSDKINLERFKNKEIDLLSCVNSGGVGFTFESISNIIIVQSNSDKKGNITQKIARALLLDDITNVNIYIICANETVDKKWVDSAISDINQDKIKIINNINEIC